MLVIGHGTADPTGAEETRSIAEEVSRLLGDIPVELGFLEVIGPSIAEAVHVLAERGCTRIVAAPLLLFTSGHALRDVPDALIAAVRDRSMDISQAAAFGCHPDMVELSRARRREALAGLGPLPAADTVLVMVGRGSSAPDCLSQFREFAQATLADDDIVGTRLEIGFVAAARPTLEEALSAAVAHGPRRVVVQPHVLFRGHVEDQVTAAVMRFRSAHPGIEWIQVSRLGADRLVGRALVGQALAAMTAVRDGDVVFSAAKNLSPEAD